MGAVDDADDGLTGVVPGPPSKLQPAVVHVAPRPPRSPRRSPLPSSLSRRRHRGVFPLIISPSSGPPRRAAAPEADDASTRCLICLDNPDDHAAPGREVGMCYKCGTTFCSACRPLLEQKLQRCPACRASLFVPLSVSVQRLKDLIASRPEGRHVAPAMNGVLWPRRFSRDVGWEHDETPSPS